eukprot:Clim_evm8s236 gene=Clim_evmTU8s236
MADTAGRFARDDDPESDEEAAPQPNTTTNVNGSGTVEPGELPPVASTAELEEGELLPQSGEEKRSHRKRIPHFFGSISPALKKDVEERLARAEDENRKRAERFGMNYKAPNPLSVMDNKEIARMKYSNPNANRLNAGVDLLSEEQQQRIKERANRFGVEQPAEESALLIKEPQPAGDYPSIYDEVMDLDTQNPVPEIPEDVQRRYDAVFLHGTDQMSTKDVLGYFEEFGPAYVEWINDSSCNVVWDDDYSAKRAIAAISTDNSMRDGEKDYGFSYRAGRPHIKASTLLLRLATVEDIKEVGAGRKSQYYKIHGNPFWRGGRGRGRGGRRRYHKDPYEKPDPSARRRLMARMEIDVGRADRREELIKTAREEDEQKKEGAQDGDQLPPVPTEEGELAPAGTTAEVSAAATTDATSQPVPEVQDQQQAPADPAPEA